MGEKGNTGLKPYLSPIMVVAFSIGSAIGWGSLVVTSSNYLGRAGSAGSIIGLLLGMAVMLIVARNYSYLMQIYPEAGGLSEFRAGENGYLQDVFERADSQMYSEKMLLKEKGSITRG